MALSIGDSACSTGLSKALFDAWVGTSGNGLVSPLTGAGLAAVQAMCFGIASGLIPYLTANAVVTTPVPVTPTTATGVIS